MIDTLAHAPPVDAALDAQVAGWVLRHPLVAEEVDCALAVMLKILDGKCKMSALDKPVMAALYRAVRAQAGLRLPDSMRTLVAQVESDAQAVSREAIYEQRVLAETMISRPVMKRFKARLRSEGLFEVLGPEAAAEEEEVA